MKLLITGGTGFIGTVLCQDLARQGHQVTVLTRSPQTLPSGIQAVSWDAGAWQAVVADVDGVVHLAGEPIAAARWTSQRKSRIRESRIQTTRQLIRAFAQSAKKPSVLISASATGYYGPRGDEPLTESEAPGTGFLAEVCQTWEAEAQQAQAFGMRVVSLRIGIVLGPGGGALAKMVPPFRAWLGGPLGSGRQWMSWIHRDDVVGLITWCLTHGECAGAVNATAPAPVTMRDFCRALGRVLHRPSWVPVPAPLLRLLLGEMSELLLTGQRVVPQAALRAGYVFRYPDLASALAVSV